MNTIPKYQNLVELFQVRSGQEPHSPLYFFSKTGLVQDNEEVTYQRFENKVKSIAALIQQYTSQGDRVLLICEPGMDYTLAYWACLYAGVLSIPAYPPINLNTIEKLQSIIANAEPTLIISNLNVIQTVKRLGLLKTMTDNPFLKILLGQFMNSPGEGLEWDFKRFRWVSINKADEVPSSSWQPRSIKPDDIAFLQYTSGSTAMPKGVMVTHANLLANLELVHRTIKQNPEDRMVSWLPPYHDMGLIGNLLFPVYCQFPIMIMSPVSFLRNPYLWVRAISDFKATISGGPNFAYELCAKKFKLSHVENDKLDLSQWRVAYNGAEPINLKTLNDFTEKFAPFGFKSHAYYPIYGLAEATVYVSGAKAGTAAAELSVDREELKKDRVILAENESKKNQILVGCGQPLVPLRIVKKNTHELCKDGEVGEIWIGGDCITKGYWGRDEETRACFGWAIKDYPDVYYLRTGDLGFVLHGNLYVTGRIKDLIIINGKNYYPQDIELMCENSHDLIRTHSVAAFSTFHQDIEELAIVAELKKTDTAEVYEEILKEICNQVNFHCGVLPSLIVLIAPKTLPKTTSGKLRRQDTRKMLEENSLEILFKRALSSGG